MEAVNFFTVLTWLLWGSAVRSAVNFCGLDSRPGVWQGERFFKVFTVLGSSTVYWLMFNLLPFLCISCPTYSVWARSRDIGVNLANVKALLNCTYQKLDQQRDTQVSFILYEMPWWKLISWLKNKCEFKFLRWFKFTVESCLGIGSVIMHYIICCYTSGKEGRLQYSAYMFQPRGSSKSLNELESLSSLPVCFPFNFPLGSLGSAVCMWVILVLYVILTLCHHSDRRYRGWSLF